MIAKTSASDTRLGAYESARLYEAVQTWKYSVDHRQHGFFLAKRQKLTHELEHDANNAHPEFTEATQQRHPSDTPTPQQEELDFKWIVGTLSQFENGFFADVDADDCFVSFVDPSTYPQNPGWMLRNLLVLVQRRWRLNRVQMLSYRDTQSRRDQANSIIMRLQCEQRAKEADGGEQLPKVTGWERNEQNKLNSRMVDLAEYMDPARLADQSVDLNLKLMKWRIAPDLDLDVVKRTKCLLLGAGTLGSYVSRNLLGWGVRHVTFVDNATVSFSNPVRQPLFKFDDCLGGGAQKAVRAAAALKEIYPGVQSTGYVLSVPMAGHAVTDEDKVRREYEQLRQLIDEHDAIFLLMDTRESRWLPTVMGKSAGKIVMNAALGFDSYVVMRHGGGGPAVATSPSPSTGVAAAAADSSAGPSLGCYFCNDVVAPADVRVILFMKPSTDANCASPPAVPHRPHARPAMHGHAPGRRSNRVRPARRAPHQRAAAPAAGLCARAVVTAVVGGRISSSSSGSSGNCDRAARIHAPARPRATPDTRHAARFPQRAGAGSGVRLLQRVQPGDCEGARARGLGFCQAGDRGAGVDRAGERAR